MTGNFNPWAAPEAPIGGTPGTGVPAVRFLSAKCSLIAAAGCFTSVVLEYGISGGPNPKGDETSIIFRVIFHVISSMAATLTGCTLMRLLTEKRDIATLMPVFTTGLIAGAKINSVGGAVVCTSVMSLLSGIVLALIERTRR